MNFKLILHIPHSSEVIPNRNGYIVNNILLDNEILKLTDWYTDDLFGSDVDISVKAEFSRIFCDVERFADDSQEIMAQFGMGVLYEKSDAGETIRKISPAIRKEILNNYYWIHHKKLSQAIQDQLKANNRAVLIDCHSFPNTPFLRDLDQRSPRPDFNIGTDQFHTPEYLIETSLEFFKEKGYSLGIDWPYKGTIVPLEYYKKNKNVESIMLEINKSLYLREPGNERTDNYMDIKKVIREYLKIIKRASSNMYSR